MGYCPYHNAEKSGPWNGWYCNKAGRYVESSLHSRYCNSVVLCEECPIYNPERYRRMQEDQERKRREELEEQERRRKAELLRNQHSKHEDRPTPVPPVGGGGLGCMDRLFFGAMTLVFGGFILFLLVTLLLSKLGFFREDVMLNLSVPGGVNPRHFAMEVISHDPREDYQVDSEKVGKDGTAKIRMEMGQNSVYLIYDDEKLSLTSDSVDGETATTFNPEYAQVRELLCRMVLMDLKDTEEAPIPAEGLTVTDDMGLAMQWMPVGENQIVLVIPDDWTGRKVTLTVDGYEPLDMTVNGKDRLEGADVRLKPTE